MGEKKESENSHYARLSSTYYQYNNRKWPKERWINKNPDLCIYSFAGNQQQIYVLLPF